MDNPETVKVGEAAEDAMHDTAGLRLREGPSIRNPLEYVAARGKIEDKAVMGGTDKVVVHLQDVWVLGFSQNREFDFKQLVLLYSPAAHKLNGHWFGYHGIHSMDNLGKTASADDSMKAVAGVDFVRNLERWPI